ncbi:phage portal protein family protein [Tenacibaculum mesophilum]|uniref:phage portal protein family protein n=1 Tax=Tenacibaculum mesophilum TaxID=104268 RepID=UPI000649C278|nr:DUF935 family protein [Tenacibaculum mesophilum]
MTKKKKTTTQTKAINLSQVLVVQPPKASSVAVEKWRSTMNAAYRGRRATYYDLIEELLSDLILTDAVGKRIRAITNSEILFQKDKKEVEPMMEFIDTPEFEELITQFMFTKFFGKTVIELNWVDGKFKPFIIPRQHLDTHRKVILKNRFDTETGWSYENDDWIINLGKDNDLGLFNKTAPFVIFKRNGGSDFAQFCEIFGISQMVGLYDPDDENGREEMETAFKNRGSGGSMTMSKNSDIKVIGQGAAGNVDIHERFLKWCDEQIIIGVNGQTMTTKDGSSLAQAKVHGETEDDLNQADRRYIQRILNTELLPRLEKRGYPVSGGKFVFAEKGEKLTKEKQLDIALKVDKVTESGVHEDYFFENFNLPKGKGKTTEEEPPVNSKKKKKDQEDEEEETQKRVTTKKLAFYDKFLDFFANAPR